MEVKKLLWLAPLSLVVSCASVPRKAPTGAIVYPYPYYPTYRKESRTPLGRFFAEGLPRLSGQKACIISNQAGLGRLLYLPATGEKHPTYLHEKFAASGAELIKVFTPEHGLSAQEEEHGNSKKEDAYYLKTIYRKTVAQKTKLFKDCQAMVFHLPDAGVRPFTYRTIFTRSIQAFDRASKEQPEHAFWMIDVPNPATHMGTFGPLAVNFSYLGEEKIPFFPGFTYGEIAGYYHSTHKLTVKLQVIKLADYKPEMHFLQSGFTFSQPSPNLPTFRSVQCYWMAVFLEGTYLDIGRNSNDPFCLIGHPSFRNDIAFESKTGTSWSTYNYVPWGGRYKGKAVRAYRMHINNATEYKPLRAAYEFIAFVRARYPKAKAFRTYPKNGKTTYFLDTLIGGATMRHAVAANKPFDEWYAAHGRDAIGFGEAMKSFKIY